MLPPSFGNPLPRQDLLAGDVRNFEFMSKRYYTDYLCIIAIKSVDQSHEPTPGQCTKGWLIILYSRTYKGVPWDKYMSLQCLLMFFLSVIKCGFPIACLPLWILSILFLSCQPPFYFYRSILPDWSPVINTHYHL